ncbi:LPS export ABC transporter periplasmic protein LptC [Gammaproteobacteria bacterium]|nr:LPS export ABC transporter periplasmic protein LptC [Gammaproteobacteria bacterium]
MRNFLVSAGLIALFSFGAHFSNKRPQIEADRKNPPPSNFYMINADLKTYDNQGKWLQNLTAKRFLHDQNTGETILTEPALTLTNNQDEFFWKIKAKQGKLSSNSDETKKLVEFWDSVTATKLNMEGEFTSLSTESLFIHPTRNYLETSSPIFIDNEMGRTSSVGLQAFLNDGNYKFFSTDEIRVSTILLQ